MNKKIWILSILGMALFSACGSSSKEGRELQQKMIKIVGIPPEIIVNICQDDNNNGLCESTELQAKVSFSQGDSMETIFSKLTQTEDGRYLLETYDASKPLLLELKDRESKYFTNKFSIPFNGFKKSEDEKELSLLQSMIDKDVLASQNVVSAKVMKNVDSFYKVLLRDLEHNIKILTQKGLSIKQAVVENIKEMADELIRNGIEDTIPTKMNACNGDKKCVANVLNPLSTELLLTEEEANAIVEKSEEDNNQPDNHSNNNKVDFANYMPKSSVTNNYISKTLSPFQENEQVSGYSTIISRENNILTYDADSSESYSTVTINSDNLLVKWKNVNYDNTKYTINRYTNIGDKIWEWKYNYDDPNHDTKSTTTYSCTLKNKINKFSHGGYTYNGDIIVEKCLINSKVSYTIDNRETITESSYIIYEYMQKDIGNIASINDICYDERGIAKTTEGCTPNGHDYSYLEQ